MIGLIGALAAIGILIWYVRPSVMITEPEITSQGGQGQPHIPVVYQFKVKNASVYGLAEVRTYCTDLVVRHGVQQAMFLGIPSFGQREPSGTVYVSRSAHQHLDRAKALTGRCEVLTWRDVVQHYPSDVLRRSPGSFRLPVEVNFDEDAKADVPMVWLTELSRMKFQIYGHPQPHEMTAPRVPVRRNASGSALFSMDVIVVVEYRPWFVPWKRRSETRFVLAEARRGQWRFVEQPVDGTPFATMQRDDKLKGLIEALNVLLQLNPSDHSTRLERAQAYAVRGQKGDVERSLEDLNHLIRTVPDHAFALLTRGAVFFHAGRFGEALKDYSTALEIEPQMHAAEYNRALSLVRLNRQREALEALSQALKNLPNDPEALFQRGCIHENSGAEKAAVQDFTAAWGLAEGHFLRTKFNSGGSEAERLREVAFAQGTRELLRDALRSRARACAGGGAVREIVNVWVEQTIPKQAAPK